MAKPPTQNRQIPLLLPLGKDAVELSSKALASAGVKPGSSSGSPNGVSQRDALIERLRRDGYFALRKK